MSTFGPTNPDENQNPEAFLQEMLRALGSAAFQFGATPSNSEGGAVNMDVARQLAHLVASHGEPESNVDPLVRFRYNELAQVASLHVGDFTGIADIPNEIAAVTPSEWANRALLSYEPFVSGIASSLGESGGMFSGIADMTPQDFDHLAQQSEEMARMFGTNLSGDALRSMFKNMAHILQPMLVGMQAGFMVGHLAGEAFTQYDIPIPWTNTNDLVVIPAHIDAFAAEWKLPEDDVRLLVLTSAQTAHAVLSRRHVRSRIIELVKAYSSGFSPDSGALQERFAGLDTGDPSAVQSALNDPAGLLDAMQTDQQRKVLADVQNLITPIAGYVRWATDQIANKLIPSHSMIDEAIRRRDVTQTQGRKFVERMLGVSIDREQYERGQAFIKGVLERDETALPKLWSNAASMPTPNEVDAPGLWLARLEITETA